MWLIKTKFKTMGMQLSDQGKLKHEEKKKSKSQLQLGALLHNFKYINTRT